MCRGVQSFVEVFKVVCRGVQRCVEAVQSCLEVSRDV